MVNDIVREREIGSDEKERERKSLPEHRKEFECVKAKEWERVSIIEKYMIVVTLNYGKFLVQATYEAGNEFAPTNIWSKVTDQKVVNQMPPSLASFDAKKSF